ncbi:MAG: type II secretion system protein, partial [Candidatus Dojkabacteria bacterium]
MKDRVIAKKQFKALGFIEVLIAIVVVGIVSAVFLSISGRAMKDLIQAERLEYMARLAKNGMNVAQEVANREKANVVTTSETNYFPDDNGKCYIPLKKEETGVGVVYSFEKEPESSNNFVSYPN